MPTQRSRGDPRNCLRRRLYKAIAHRAARCTAVSADVQRALCEHLGFDATRTMVLGNGIDTAAYASVETAAVASLRQELGLAAAARVIVAVGRLVPNKGQRDLIAAMPAVLARCPDAVLVLVGEGPDHEELARRVAAQGLERAVRMAGGRSDVADHLALAEIFALTSSSEGVPLALLEAMAAGKPIVATAVAGIVDIIEDGRTGQLVPHAEPTALATAIGDMLEHRDRASALGAAAQCEARARYDIDLMVRATAAMYVDVMDAAR